MKKSSFLLLCASLFLAGKSFAQTPVRHCNTDEMRQVYILQHPEILQYEADLENQIQQSLKKINLSQFSRTTTSDQSGNINFWYDIPVVVHIIHDYNSNAEYLTDDNIFNYLIIWNKIYSCQSTSGISSTPTDTSAVIAPFKKYVGNAHIRLHLATIDPQGKPTKGITRRRSYQTYNGNDQAKYDDWDPASYVNIWTIKTMNVYTNSTAAAYATPPSSGAAAPYRDGIISLYDYLDNDNTINHEMGHVFNLAHPWGNNNNAAQAGVTCVDGGSAGVDDTPPTLGHMLGGCSAANLYDTVCATNYYKVYVRPSTGATDSLVNYPDTVNAQNIMDYTYCSKNFTKGQCDRMHAALNSGIAHRNNLWDTTNLIRTGVLTASYAFAPRPDLPPIPEYCVNNGTKVQYFTIQGTALTFKNRTWNDTVTSMTWTFSNGASTPTQTVANPTYNTTLGNSFSQPGWVTVNMSATGNHTGTTSASSTSVFVADATATSGAGYYQGFDPAGDVAKWPTFNYFNNEFKWEAANVGMYDNHCLKYTGFDSRLDPSIGLYPNVGSPFGDYDDFYSIPFNLSSFGTGPCNLNFYTSGASRSSNSLDITDTFEISYSTDAMSWVKLTTISKGDLVNKGAIATDYTPATLADWVPRPFN